MWKWTMDMSACLALPQVSVPTTPLSALCLERLGTDELLINIAEFLFERRGWRTADACRVFVFLHQHRPDRVFGASIFVPPSSRGHGPEIAPESLRKSLEVNRITLDKNWNEATIPEKHHLLRGVSGKEVRDVAATDMAFYIDTIGLYYRLRAGVPTALLRDQPEDSPVLHVMTDMLGCENLCRHSLHKLYDDYTAFADSAENGNEALPVQDRIWVLPGCLLFRGSAECCGKLAQRWRVCCLLCVRPGRAPSMAKLEPGPSHPSLASAEGAAFQFGCICRGAPGRVAHYSRSSDNYVMSAHASRRILQYPCRTEPPGGSTSWQSRNGCGDFCPSTS
jgi:hypothetical protein